MGLFYGHRCKVCRVKYPNNQMRPAGLGWICLTCLRERNLGKRGK